MLFRSGEDDVPGTTKRDPLKRQFLTPYELPGFWVKGKDGKIKACVMYDKNKDEFVEGFSSFHYTYKGQTEKDDRILELVKNNLS